MIPLRNNLIVKMDESLPNQVGLHIATDIDNWKMAAQQLGNRGKVIAVGPGQRHPKTAILLKPQCQVGDIVRFSELGYPAFFVNGQRYIVINDQDVVGVVK